jgi:hypothetical protein
MTRKRDTPPVDPISGAPDYIAEAADYLASASGETRTITIDPGSLTGEDDNAGERQVIWVTLDDVKMADRNPRDHDIPALMRGILRFGFTAPPILDTRTGKLVAGHGRCTALGELRGAARTNDQVAEYLARSPAERAQHPLPKGIWLDRLGRWAPRGIKIRPGDGAWVVPILAGWASDSDVEAAGYLIGDNHLGELTTWDRTGLAALLSEVAEHDTELLLATGHTGGDLDDLLKSLEPMDLDDFADKVGDGSDDDGWPTIKFKVPHHISAAWAAHVDTHMGDEVQALASLLEIDAEPPVVGDNFLRDGAGLHVDRAADDDAP